MSPLGKRSRPQSMSWTPSTAELGSLCDILSLNLPDHDPAAMRLQQNDGAAAPTTTATAAAISAGRARRQRQQQAQPSPRRSTGLVENGYPCCWSPAFAAGNGVVQWSGTNGFTAAVAALEPAQFLKACGLCNRRLGPGKDTYMYRGDMAFCSADCRDLRIALDERGATCSMASVATAAAATTTSAAGSKATKTAA